MDKRGIAFIRTEHTTSSSLEALAAQQGAVPIDDFAILVGDPIPLDESVEEFSAFLRKWRGEGLSAATS